MEVMRWITPFLACEAEVPTVLRPQLAFLLAGESNFAAARDLTVAPDGNIFIFDYDVTCRLGELAF